MRKTDAYAERRRRRVKAHPLKKALLYASVVIIVTAVGLLLAMCLPYAGTLDISEASRDTFTTESFFSETVSDERVMILDEPDIALLHRINVIKEAKERILFSTFLFYGGESSDIFAGALLDAADRGVEVTVLVDKWGSIPPSYKNCFLEHPNIEYYVFCPINLLEPKLLNSSLHDKIVIVDDAYFIIGGRNIGDQYFVEGVYKYRYDLDVLVYNTAPEIIGSLEQGAEYYGQLINATVTEHIVKKPSNSETTDADKKHLISRYQAYTDTHIINNPINYDNLTTPANKITLIHNSLISDAKKEPTLAYALLELAKKSDSISILSPYVVLSSDNFALFSEAVRGKDVSMITNSLAVSHDRFSYSNFHVSRDKYLKSGVNVYEYQKNGTALHGKAYLFDDRLCAIGSFNLDERGIRVDTESMVVIDSPAFNDVARATFQKYLNDCLQVDPASNTYIASENTEPAQPAWYKGALFKLLGYLMYLVIYLV